MGQQYYYQINILIIKKQVLSAVRKCGVKLSAVPDSAKTSVAECCLGKSLVIGTALSHITLVIALHFSFLIIVSQLVLYIHSSKRV